MSTLEKLSRTIDTYKNRYNVYPDILIRLDKTEIPPKQYIPWENRESLITYCLANAGDPKSAMCWYKEPIEVLSLIPLIKGRLVYIVAMGDGNVCTVSPKEFSKLNTK